MLYFLIPPSFHDNKAASYGRFSSTHLTLKTNVDVDGKAKLSHSPGHHELLISREKKLLATNCVLKYFCPLEGEALHPVEECGGKRRKLGHDSPGEDSAGSSRTRAEANPLASKLGLSSSAPRARPVIQLPGKGRGPGRGLVQKPVVPGRPGRPQYSPLPQASITFLLRSTLSQESTGMGLKKMQCRKSGTLRCDSRS